jgi:hypothetical protein
MVGADDASFRRLWADFISGALRRRTKGAIAVGLVVVTLFLILIPVLPYEVLKPANPSVRDGQSILYVSVGYGFISGYCPGATIHYGSSRFYAWCSNIGSHWCSYEFDY